MSTAEDVTHSAPDRGRPSPGLFTRLVDDAAMFPPGNADPATAIEHHLRYRSSPLDPYVGPLLVHVDRWAELAGAHASAGSPPLDVVVLGTAELPPGVPGLRVMGFELPVPSLPLPIAPPGLSVACEVRADGPGLAVLREMAVHGGGRYVGKFRTGGVTADAFPDEATLARFLVAGVRVGTPMKFTAGLHHAVRFRDATTGFEHHGFLNLLVAVDTALAGAPERAVARVLARRGSALADEVCSWDDETVAAVRRVFVSFGCCGVEDPLHDLVDLRLLSLEGPR